jgi:hypothetical protein
VRAAHEENHVPALHATYDPIVNPNQITQYDVLTREAGTQRFFAANFVVARGRCAFTNEQIAGAFDALVTWVHMGQRPAPGPVVPHPVAGTATPSD